MKRLLTWWVLTILLLMNPFLKNADAQETKVVRIGYYENDTFQAGASDDKIKTGYSYEYMRRLQSYTDWTYEYVYGEYGELYEKLISGDIDILTGLAYKEERAFLIGYPSMVMGDTPYTFLKRSEETEINDNPSTISGKKIGVLKGAMEGIVEKYLKTKRIKAEIVLFDDLEKRDAALLSKDVDITIVEGNGTKAAEGVEAFAEAGSTDYFVCTNINRPDILEDLNAAQEEMFRQNPNLRAELDNKWFRNNVVSSTLTSEEQEWLDTHKTFTVGYFSDYLPFAGTDSDGNVTGVIRDLLPEIFRNLGADSMKINYVGFDSYADMLTAINAGEIDACFPTYVNYWTSEAYGLMPTNSVYSAFFNLVYDGNYPEMKNAKIALRDSNMLVREFCRVQFPESRIVSYNTVEECLDAVAAGEVDATLINGIRTDQYLREKDIYKSLSAAQIPGEVPLGFAVSIREHGTIDTLNHGIELTDPDFALTNTYQYVEQYQMSAMEFIRQNLWFPAIVGLFFVLIVTFFLARQLRKDKKYLAQEQKQKEAKAAEEAIVNSFVSMYFCALEMDLETGKTRVIRIPAFMKDRFDVDGFTFDQLREPFTQMCVDPKYQDEIREFLDFESIKEDITHRGYLQKNYIGKTEGWCRITIVPVKDGKTDKVSKMVLAIANINEEKKREARITYKAEHDALTGLLNRRAFSKTEAVLRNNEKPMAVMIMDVDHFKTVNDTYGHDVGDIVLKEVASLLKTSFRKSDLAFRYGGDEFVVIADCGEGFTVRIEEIIREMNDKLLHPTKEGLPPVSVSAGMAAFTDAYDEQILKQADIALYHTKMNGRAGITIYDEDRMQNENAGEGKEE